METAFVLLILLCSGNAQPFTKIEQFLQYFQSNLKDITTNVKMHPDTGLNMSQFLNKYNYPLEQHTVQTDDGFFLTLHRIKHGRNDSSENEDGPLKPVVVLVHGLFCSAMDWIYTGPEKSLPLILADTGYDIWLVNTRGSRYSMKHNKYNTSDSAFWDYSWHEKGYYDLAASLDYVLNVSTVSDITLIGHSEGTTASLVLTSTKTEYNSKINVMIFLSPIAYMNELGSPLILLMAKYMEPIKIILEVLNIYGIPYLPTLNNIFIALCNDGSPVQELCANLIELLVGYDFAQLNKTLLTVILTSTPAGVSIKEIEHYGQEIKSGRFCEYDYGWLNIFHYNNTEPPSYNVKSITTPVVSYYSQNDFFAAVKNVEHLLNQLPNEQRNMMENEFFNHLDFLIANDVRKQLYQKVVANVKMYNPLNDDCSN